MERKQWATSSNIARKMGFAKSTGIHLLRDDKLNPPLLADPASASRIDIYACNFANCYINTLLTSCF
jgi:hypothetical protein